MRLKEITTKQLDEFMSEPAEAGTALAEVISQTQSNNWSDGLTCEELLREMDSWV